MRFDSWYKEHKHLFVINKKISLEIASTLTYKDAVAKAKELLKGKTDRQTDFELSSTRFRYLEIDDYLKCYKLKRKDKKLFDIGTMLEEEYLKKQERYKNSKKLLLSNSPPYRTFGRRVFLGVKNPRKSTFLFYSD